MDYYADAEGGAYVEDPDHAALARLVGDPDTAGNPFFVVYPSEQDLEWFISVSKNVGPFGGYDMHRHDPAASEDAKDHGRRSERHHDRRPGLRQPPLTQSETRPGTATACRLNGGSTRPAPCSGQAGGAALTAVRPTRRRAQRKAGRSRSPWGVMVKPASWSASLTGIEPKT